MTITINGDGTIGGVSVGGLPDGIVDTDMLASGAVTDAVLPAGSVLQVVSTSTTTQVQTSSTSDSDTGLTVSITPSSTSSKVIVEAFVLGVYKHSTNAACRVHLKIKRNGATISDSGANFFTNVADSMRGGIAMCVVDTPNSTSSVEYKVTVSSDDGHSYVAVQKDGNSGASTLVLTEVKV